MVTKPRVVIALVVGSALSVALAMPAGSGPLTGSGLSGAGRWETLEAPVPAWYTPDLHRRVLAAGPGGIPVPAGAEIPTSSLLFQGIRPGQLTYGNNPEAPGAIGLCSSNFVFTRGDDFFLGTAGHCAAGLGWPVTMLFLPKGLVRIGEVVLLDLPDEEFPFGTDFALVAIDPELYQHVSPSMPYFGGPTGVYTGSSPEIIQHAGWGLAGMPRVGLAKEWTPENYFFHGAAIPGDSGSASIVLGGLGAGNITHLWISPSDYGFKNAIGTTLAKIMEILDEADGDEGPQYELATCPAIPWPLPGCPA